MFLALEKDVTRRRTAYPGRVATAPGAPVIDPLTHPHPEVSAGWCSMPGARCPMPDAGLTQL